MVDLLRKVTIKTCYLVTDAAEETDYYCIQGTIDVTGPDAYGCCIRIQ